MQLLPGAIRAVKHIDNRNPEEEEISTGQYQSFPYARIEGEPQTSESIKNKGLEWIPLRHRKQYLQDKNL